MDSGFGMWHVSLICDFFMFWSLPGCCSRVCEEEETRNQEAILKVDRWCYFGGHSEEASWEARSSWCCQRICTTVCFLFPEHSLYQSLKPEMWLTKWIRWFCSEIKERIKKTKDEKKAKKAEFASKQQKSQVKGNIPKAAAPRAAKMGGGGGKRWMEL